MGKVCISQVDTMKISESSVWNMMSLQDKEKTCIHRTDRENKGKNKTCIRRTDEDKINEE